MHVSAVLKDSATYEHVPPETVGNRQRVLVSDLSGRGNILYKLKQHGLADRLDEDARRELLERIKHMEYDGYELEAAEGTFELLVREALHPGMHFFEVDSYEVATRGSARLPRAPPPPSPAGRGRRAFRHRHGPRPVQRAAPVPAQVPREALSAISRRCA